MASKMGNLGKASAEDILKEPNNSLGRCLRNGRREHAVLLDSGLGLYVANGRAVTDPMLLVAAIAREGMAATDNGWSNESRDRQNVAIEAVSERFELQMIARSPPPPDNHIPGVCCTDR
jgi:hypothetical protein